MRIRGRWITVTPREILADVEAARVRTQVNLEAKAAIARAALSRLEARSARSRELGRVVSAGWWARFNRAYRAMQKAELAVVKAKERGR